MIVSVMIVSVIVVRNINPYFQQKLWYKLMLKYKPEQMITYLNLVTFDEYGRK